MKDWILIIIFILLVSASITWTVIQWNECKEMGHSTLYCIGHILK